MSNIKRYSLVAFDSKTKEEALMGINIDNNGSFIISGKKGVLSAIDKYTMHFENSDELEYNLMDIGVIDRISNLYIRYEHKGPRKTPILYKDDEGMLPFTSELSTYVDKETSYFKELLNKLLNSSKNKNYIEYMNKYGYINEYLYRKLNDYKNGTMTYNELNFLVQKIADQLSAYKTIRDIYIGTKRYKNKEEIHNDESISGIVLPVGEVERYRLNEEEQAILDVFLRGGEEELYSLYDIENIPDKVYKKIRDYHKKGL